MYARALTIALSICLQFLSANTWAQTPIGPVEASLEIPNDSVFKLGAVDIPEETEFGFLDACVANSMIVGLGECSHYTRECYTVKHAVIQQLARYAGFDSLILEVDFGQALKWNDYVVNGHGDLDDLIRGTGWFTYKTHEFRNVLKSLRRYNKTAKRKIHIYGMEMTYVKDNFEWLVNYLKEHSERYDEIQVEIESKRKHLAFANHTDRECVDYWRLYFRLNAFLNREREKLISHSSEQDYQTAAQIVEIFRQYSTYISQSDSNFQLELRDKFSTRNVLWVMGQRPNSKAILWAHNGHVCKSYHYDVLGRNLAARLGNRYFSIGFMFGKGKFGSHDDNWEFKTFEYPMPKPGTIESRLGQYNSNLFLNIRQATQNSSNHPALDHPISARVSIGEQLRKTRFDVTSPIVLKEIYDGVFFLQETSSARRFE